MQQLTETTVASLPTPLSPTIARGIAMLVSKLAPPITPSCSSYSIAPVDAPSQETRDGLDRRRQRIDGWFQPAGERRALVEVTALFTVMGHKSADETKAAAQISIYVADLKDLPYFALTEACQALRQGAVGEGKWVPEPGVIRIEAAKRMAPLAKERREITAILEARVEQPSVSGERKRQLLEYCRGTLLPEMKFARPRNEWRPDQPKKPDPETPQETLERLKGQPLPPLSDEVLGQFPNRVRAAE